MIAVLGNHLLMNGAGAMNPNAEPTGWNSLYIAQIALENLHGVPPLFFAQRL
jgi:hypothetical protein